MFFDVNMKSLTFPRHVQAPLHLVYCGSWCVTQVYTAYLTSAVIFKRERERERKRQRGRKECRFSYFRIFRFYATTLMEKQIYLGERSSERHAPESFDILSQHSCNRMQSQVAKSHPKIWLVQTLHLRLLQAGCGKTTSQFLAFGGTFQVYIQTFIVRFRELSEGFQVDGLSGRRETLMRQVYMD